MTLSPRRTGVITIDGPAGAGKSTVAHRLASRLSVDFLDTGAMYRAVAAAALDRGVDPADQIRVADLAEEMNIRFRWDDDPPTLLIDGRDVMFRLRDADVTAAVSDVAANSQVRNVLVRAQRWIGRQRPGLVTEGRDQGSVVFPDARVKFYLDASPQVRAERRARQLREMGRDANVEVILDQIVRRDRRDLTRMDGPLVCPEGAVRIDSSVLGIDEVLNTMLAAVNKAVEHAASPGDLASEAS